MEKISNTKEFRLDILVLKRIAEAFSCNIHLRKTRLHLASKLRWDSFVRYLEWLQNSNYVVCHISNGIQLYSLTHTGKEMLARLMNFLQYLK
ncbi:MAG: hypothetical protein KGL95_15985 [Patescibacteria group bacterium]|nr:hypothetical protein [Patescibacteria group bacterium]